MCVCCGNSREQEEHSPPRLLAACLLPTCRISTRRQVTGCAAVGLTPLINPSDCTTVDHKLRISHPIISQRQLATMSPLKFPAGCPVPTRRGFGQGITAYKQRPEFIYATFPPSSLRRARRLHDDSALSCVSSGTRRKKVTQRKVWRTVKGFFKIETQTAEFWGPGG